MRHVKFAAGALFVLAASQARAQVYVGSFQVDKGPSWTSNPTVYSALDAAALLFGGSPTDYSISTLGNNPASINHMEWTSTVYVAGGHMYAENYKVGTHYQDAGGTSAYVNDNAQGNTFTNYVFRNRAATATPEFGSVFSLGGLLAAGGAGVWIRRKRRSA